MPGQDHVKLFFAGDLMSGRGIDQLLPHPNEPTLYESYVRDARQYIALAEEHSGPISQPVDLDYVWGDALEVLARARPDLRMVNLETALTTSEDCWPEKGIHYRMHPHNARSLNELGLDCCALANNHLLDWGYDGLDETLEVLREIQIAGCGAGRNLQEAAAPAVLPVPTLVQKGTRVLVFSFGLPSSGIPLNWAAGENKAGVCLLPDLSDQSLSAAVTRIQQYKQPGDLVVASVHWGVNWGYQIAGEQRHFARALVDAGVDLVHGHSSHHPIGMEVYRQRLICYGCGDFVNDYEGIHGYEAFRAHVSLMYFLTLRLDGKMNDLQIAPMQMNRLRLQYATEDDTAWMATVLDRESSRHGLRLRVKHHEGEPRPWIEGVAPGTRKGHWI